ncbi:AAA family ATPase [Mycena indigotica]|uniref:AAA family ATPase n=1 Tax=Mycena indigotica TaxID=2126181 RepID=A0A8H6W131_9AGAR|nr:AAA family ATPase [Mycena indigotica]KAF7299131.1 AAA family ATPase [Mycena indigotica]
MKRHSVKGIRNDQLEQNRIQLEHNLQHTEPSLHLSSNDNSVEYPRHAPTPFRNDFIDFDRHEESPWSYEEGLTHSPYGGGETISTAAHHASVLTLNAGLAGRGNRRDISLSGAEFDPERPLKDMMAAVDPKLSMFDMDPSRSRYNLPLNSPGRLDRALQSGHSRSVRIRSPHSSATSSSSDSESPRPRLAEALQRVSPKRPRSPQLHQPNHRHAQIPPSPLSKPLDDATPRPQRRGSTASHFTKAARGVARDLAEEQQKERNPFADIVNRDATSRSLNNTKSRIYLPDVTGLTNAVESPAKPGGYTTYNPDFDRPRDSEARLLSTLAAVQERLHDLEDENAISRRRVRELELELEVCKREVVKERTRILERSELSARLEAVESSKGKGKGKARDVDTEIDAQLEERYRQAVEEKKSLEALISSLRSHLTRLTSELSSHQDLLMELRKLRERDSRLLKEKSAEVDRLRQEVERLAGEVEVLRGVVEDGLRERRGAREEAQTSGMQSAGDTGMSADLDETVSRRHVPDEQEDEEDGLDEGSSIEEEEESEAEPFDPMSIMGSSRENAAGRTDHATLGSSRFIGNDELVRIIADVEERRSELSSNASRERPVSPSPSPPRERNRRATVEEVSDEGSEHLRAPTPVARAGPSKSRISHPARPPVPTPSRARNGNPDAEAPFPQIRGARLEKLFFSAPEHNARTCTVCCRGQRAPSSWLTSRPQEHLHESDSEEDEGFVDGDEDVDVERARQEKRDGKQRQPDDINFAYAARKAGVPPQTLVTRVIRDLEDDFVHYKSVYVELADQYKEMDAVSDVPKRNLLAKHLREVVDILEQKGDQIAALYSCLSFKDKPIRRTAGTQ